MRVEMLKTFTLENTIVVFEIYVQKTVVFSACVSKTHNVHFVK